MLRDNLLERLEYVIRKGVATSDGAHPISAEVVRNLMVKVPKEEWGRDDSYLKCTLLLEKLDCVIRDGTVASDGTHLISAEVVRDILVKS